MAEISSIQQVPVSAHADLRKVLLYNARTCPGSCGSPILTFKRPSSDGGENSPEGLESELWMHCGMCVAHGRGGSVMKRLIPDVGHHRRSDAILERVVAEEDEGIVEIHLAHVESNPPELLNPELSLNQTADLIEVPQVASDTNVAEENLGGDDETSQTATNASLNPPSVPAGSGISPGDHLQQGSAFVGNVSVLEAAAAPPGVMGVIRREFSTPRPSSPADLSADNST